MIHVLATIEVQPGKRDAFLREFWGVVPAVRAETGCIEYGPAVDMDSGMKVQRPLRPDAVVVIEKWQSLEALRAHLSMPHMEAYRERVKGLVAGVDLQILTTP